MTISPENKSRLWKAGAVLVLLVAAFAGGRYSNPGKTVEHVVTQTVVQDHVVTVDKVVTQTVYVKQVAKNVQTDTVVTKKADGTVVTETKISDTTKIGVQEAKQSSSQSTQDVKFSESTKTDTLKVTDNSKPQWHLSVRGGAGARFIGQTTPVLILGVGVERRIIGPLFVGLWGQTTLNLVSPGTPPYEAAGGLSLVDQNSTTCDEPKMTVKELSDKLIELVDAGQGKAVVAFDTEARTFNVHLVEVKSIFYDVDVCRDLGTRICFSIHF